MLRCLDAKDLNQNFLGKRARQNWATDEFLSGVLDDRSVFLVLGHLGYDVAVLKELDLRRDRQACRPDEDLRQSQQLDRTFHMTRKPTHTTGEYFAWGY